MILLLFLPFPLAVIWAFVTWRYIATFTRMNAALGYSNRRFFPWFFREYPWTFFFGNALNVILIILVIYKAITLDDYRGYVYIEALILLNVISAVSNLVFVLLPNDPRISTFKPSLRSLRLSVLTIVLSLIFAIGIPILLFAVYSSSYEFPTHNPSLSLLPLLCLLEWALVGGPIAVFLSPLVLPFANFLISPFEETLNLSIPQPNSPGGKP